MLGKDLYTMFSQNGVPNVNNDATNGMAIVKREPFLSQEIKQEPTDVSSE